jgi:hypothetical protein
MNSITELPFELAPGYARKQFLRREDAWYLRTPCHDPKCELSGYCCQVARVKKLPPMNRHQLNALRKLRDLIDSGTVKQKFADKEEAAMTESVRVLAAACEYAHSGCWSRRMNLDVNAGIGHHELRYWGLVTYALYSEAEKLRWANATYLQKVARKGMWRITESGRAFLNDKLEIDEHVWVADGDVVGYEHEPTWLSIGAIT